MTGEIPFYLTKVECPVCKAINEFETIKVGSYIESGRDTDFCPTGRSWRNPRYQSYNPLLYFSGTCTNCYYSREFTKAYKDWKDNAYFKTYRQKTIKERHLNLLGQSDSMIKFIGEKLDNKRYPNETAVLKLILAVIDESLNDKQIYLDLGRFFLRIGWLFREMENGESNDGQAINSCLIDIDQSIEKLKDASENAQTKLSDVNQVINSQFEDEEIAAELESAFMPFKEKYDSELTSLKEVFTMLSSKINNLEKIAQEYRKVVLGTTDDNSSHAFYEYSSFYNFLGELSKKWEDTPQNEKQALEKAVHYYKLAFTDGRSIAKGYQQLQASYLIAELSRRIGQHEQAKEYFNTTIRNGQEMVYRNRNDRSKTALAKKILELAIEQARHSFKEAKNTK